MRNNQAISFPANGFVLSAGCSNSNSAKPHSRTNRSFLTCIAVSDDEKLLATASLDATLCIWDELSHHLWEAEGNAWGMPLKTFYLPSVATAIRFVDSASADSTAFHMSDKLKGHRRNSLIISTLDGSCLLVELGNAEIMRSIYIDSTAISEMNFARCVTNSLKGTQQKESDEDMPQAEVRIEKPSFISIVGLISSSKKSHSPFVYSCTAAGDLYFHDFENGRQVCRLSIRDAFEKHRRDRDAAGEVAELHIYDGHTKTIGSAQSIEVLFGTFYTEISKENERCQMNHVLSIEIEDWKCIPLDLRVSIGSSSDKFEIDHRLLKVLQAAQCLVPMTISEAEGISIKNAQIDCSQMNLYYADSCKEMKFDENSLRDLIENCKSEHGFPKYKLGDSKKHLPEKRKKQVSLAKEVDQTNKTFELEVDRLTEIRNAWLEYIETLC
ncbi:hypothetical protein XU18_4041 [Perkinsela sp. CCAP 1560/4]|nr:hypothetical protein XU18_4041 [Perkinsela sp. CCAP 1560/4]|eukprot:KNH04754.1 hypothetical protein XU18_4041 [Perkinsela sp. CCAP 1560/4]